MSIKSLWNDTSLHKANAWADIIFVHPFSLPLSKGLAKFKVNPNYVTVSTIPICFIAALLFAKGYLIYGALFFWLGYILDGTDGELARLTNRQSKFGSKLDARTDVLNHFMLYCGLFYSQFYLIGEWIEGMVLILLHYGLIFTGIIYIRDTNYKTFSPKLFSYFSSFEEGFFTFLVGPMLGMVEFFFLASLLIQGVTHMVLLIKRGESLSFDEFKTRVKRSIFRVIE